jgi:serine/threonine protein kinase
MVGGRYTLLEELGSGGMAVVWRARDEVLGRSVAVKLLAGRHVGDPQSRARIREEARAAATFSHPHIAQVYDFGESDEAGRHVPYVVMELVHGITLQQRAAAGVLAPKQVFQIGAQVAAALAAAHARGLVHRDIKPANVMVTQEGVKVVDFGIAALAGPVDPEEELFGTPAYLAPERLIGAAVEPASDVYALGVLLYRLLAGGSPWSASSTTQMLDAHVYVEPVPLPELPEVPVQVTDLVNQCLRKETAERPTAAQVAAILAGATEEVSPVLPPVASPDRRRPGKVLLAGGVAVAAAGALLMWTLLPLGAEGASTTTAAPPSVPAPSAGVQATTATARPAVPAVVPTRTPSAAPTATTATPAPAKTSVSPSGKPSPSASVSPSATAPASPEPTGSPGPVLTFTSVGGTIEARCTAAGKARLVAWAAKIPYKVNRVNSGPAVRAVIVFKHGSDRVRMTVTCVEGVPTVVTVPL